MAGPDQRPVRKTGIAVGTFRRDSLPMISPLLYMVKSLAHRSHSFYYHNRTTGQHHYGKLFSQMAFERDVNGAFSHGSHKEEPVRSY